MGPFRYLYYSAHLHSPCTATFTNENKDEVWDISFAASNLQRILKFSVSINPMLPTLPLIIQQKGRWTSHQAWEKGHSNDQSSFTFQRALSAQNKRDCFQPSAWTTSAAEQRAKYVVLQWGLHSEYSRKRFAKETKQWKISRR